MKFIALFKDGTKRYLEDFSWPEVYENNSFENLFKIISIDEEDTYSFDFLEKNWIRVVGKYKNINPKTDYKPFDLVLYKPKNIICLVKEIKDNRRVIVKISIDGDYYSVKFDDLEPYEKENN